jgi:hypothetical protein
MSTFALINNYTTRYHFVQSSFTDASISNDNCFWATQQEAAGNIQLITYHMQQATEYVQCDSCDVPVDGYARKDLHANNYMAVNRHAVKLSFNIPEAHSIADDGHGNLLMLTLESKSEIHWFEIIKACHGQYGGKLLTSDNSTGQYHNIAVDANSKLLYVGQVKNIAVYNLEYSLTLQAK